MFYLRVPDDNHVVAFVAIKKIFTRPQQKIFVLLVERLTWIDARMTKKIISSADFNWKRQRQFVREIQDVIEGDNFIWIQFAQSRQRRLAAVYYPRDSICAVSLHSVKHHLFVIAAQKNVIAFVFVLHNPFENVGDFISSVDKISQHDYQIFVGHGDFFY